MRVRSQRVVSLALALGLGACSGEAAKHAARTASPLVGGWTRDGDVPKPSPDRPQFTKLTFRPDGSLDASYVSAGGALAGVLNKAPKVMQERDSYTIVDSHTVRIAEGSSARDYQYDVHDGKLYLTPPNAQDAAVFSKSNDV
jgi:hypothetical protein